MTYETARNIIGWYDVYGRQAKVAADILWLFWKELCKYGTGACVAERTFLSKGDGEFKIAFSVRDMGDVWYFVAPDGTMMWAKLGRCTFHDAWRFTPEAQV